MTTRSDIPVITNEDGELIAVPIMSEEKIKQMWNKDPDFFTILAFGCSRMYQNIDKAVGWDQIRARNKEQFMIALGEELELDRPATEEEADEYFENMHREYSRPSTKDRYRSISITRKQTQENHA